MKLKVGGFGSLLCEHDKSAMKASSLFDVNGIKTDAVIRSSRLPRIDSLVQVLGDNPTDRTQPPGIWFQAIR